ncbi:pSer/pThr/pTyr-binding forkhead associated (FHA) protein [Thermostichus sp. MS-CIW-21]|jgi:pSer/pThr/pTyr-binding forkhead associated (FHA) protein|uniref:FHA domain-containing protein n=1 Tax=unclassified Synechococcus TaxID=2626047 RepID=UPI0000694231|nr:MULTISPECIES: FHA domain-containing protein [unclassified Synechococcus]ABC99139.1 FHA domain protein [Synechococcus sp. JA-3-3Ab]PIK85498.1 signal peptide protein [Synechococcus sp. 63AY4M2]PIK88752.1 signal peptide protein [Synechococcus sp. 65AY6A5]PIK90811.1 signal peptide protein [Synechococcus sp. 65AY6Li]PIK94551.1 signal peptide protein [Synechococcus sp. 60AY4M2]
MVDSAPSPPSAQQHILVVEDRDGRRSQVLTSAKYFIGRDLANDICLNSQYASRYHAMLLRVPAEKEGEYYYRILDGDLEGRPSTNGLLINGQKISTHQLKSGDVISFGPDAKATYIVKTS